jgi:hypothetical protein
MTFAPAAMAARANLWPQGMSPVTVTDAPPASTVVPAAMACKATATLSRGSSTSTPGRAGAAGTAGTVTDSVELMARGLVSVQRLATD